MKTKKILAFMLICAFVISGFSGISSAKADTACLMIDRKYTRVIDAEPGTTVHVKVPVIAVTNFAYNPIVVTTFEEDVPFTTSQVTLTQSGVEAMLISTSDYTYAEFDVYMKDSAAIGNYDLGITFAFDIAAEDGIVQKEETHKLSIHVAEEKNPAQLSISDISYKEDDAAVGNTFSVSFTVVNDGEIEALNTYYSIAYGTTGIIPDYSVETVKIGSLKAGDSKKITLDMEALPTAEAGYKTLTANFTYKNAEGKEYTAAKNIYVTIKSTSVASTEDASLILDNGTMNEDVLPGTELKLEGVIENIGAQKATDIKITIPDGTGVTSGIIANYNSDGISLKNIAAGSSSKFKIPLTVSKTAAAGLKELTVQVSYNDSQKKSHTIVKKFYITVVAVDESDETSTVSISNISQNPSSPMVGEVIFVSFTVENKGSKPVTEVKVAGKDLSNSGFEPITADPSEKVGTLKAGEKKNVTMQFTTGKNIAEGLSPLTLTCSYKDSSNKSQSFETIAYILNVQNNSNSKPKLIVSGFSTDKEQLKAGSEFLLTFSLKNTHISKAAKNIKVTVSQKDSIFSASEGSNSFYIDQIKPGDTTDSTIPMKVKSDAATGAYDLNIDVEYEYDGMTEAEQEKGGVTANNIIKLQAEENARPVIENVIIGSYDMPTVNQPAAMSFEFYNMGKSKLENVYFTFEGDFQLETGDKLILGSVDAGVSEYVEPNVIPLVEGNATGKIIIHFENSNGDEITVEKEIPETMVQGEMTFDPGTTGGDVPVINDNPVDAKKDILPLWLFIVLQVAVVVVFVPVTRLIIIRIHKRKLMKAEDRL